MISFVVPAHNEAELLGRTLAALTSAAPAGGQPWEVIVVNDASTDRTAEIGAAHGACVITVNHRQIAATRNAGARAAAGDVLMFVDADTVASPKAVRAAVRALQGGAIGGGCIARFDGPVPLYAAILERAVLPVLVPLFKMAPGCFLFCTRAAYSAAGGFDEGLYWSEEVAFGNRLKRLGRFVILRERVATSGRKMRTHSALGLLRVGLRLAVGRPSGLDYWYSQRAANQYTEQISGLVPSTKHNDSRPGQ
jgi:glycosyltransferase involved in cell wall biosynthesis